MNYGTMWFKRAKSNLAKAELGRETAEILNGDLYFDAQQATEKALKGIITFLKIDIPKTHSIGYLLKVIEEYGIIWVPENLKEAVILTHYAVTTRYPEDWEAIDEAEYTMSDKK